MMAKGTNHLGGNKKRKREMESPSEPRSGDMIESEDEMDDKHLEGYDDVEEEEEEEEKERLKKEAIAYRESLEKRGVIYMSRVPPFMKPNKVRTLLEEYGEITRLFLAEEGQSLSLRFINMEV